MQPWLAALPTPTSAGALNNFLAPPIPDSILADSDYYMWRLDVQGGTNHVFASFWHQTAPPKFYSQLPQAISNEIVFRPAELLGQPVELRQDHHVHAGQSHVRRVLEPERGLRLRQRELRGPVPADRRHGGQFGGAADRPRSVRGPRVQRRSPARADHDAPDLHRQRRRDVGERHAHAEGRHGMAQDHGQPALHGQRGRHRSSSGEDQRASLA